jgi:hypothetical protein
LGFGQEIAMHVVGMEDGKVLGVHGTSSSLQESPHSGRCGARGHRLPRL